MTITPPEGFQPVPEPTNDYPRTWNWDQDGDTIEGDYHGSRDTSKGKVYEIATDKETVSVWGTAVLDRKIQGVQQGQTVWIKRLGLEELQNGRKAWMFEVFVKPAAAA